MLRNKLRKIIFAIKGNLNNKSFRVLFQKYITVVYLFYIKICFFKNIRKIVIRDEDYLVDKLHNIIPLVFNKNKLGFFFLQVGANDGVRFDPIYKVVTQYNLPGICMEPILEYFLDLQKNYHAYNCVTPINYALYEKDGSALMYKVKKESMSVLPDWSKGIASLHSSHHMLSGTSGEHMETTEVQTISFSGLIKKYKIKNIDTLVIDTEGFDFEIIKMFDFDIFKPKIIYLEHGIRDRMMSSKNFQSLLGILVGHGYLIEVDLQNMLCYLED